MVALRPKRDGDFTSDPEQKWVVAKPPADNADPDLVWAEAKMERRESGGTSVDVTDPDGREIHIGEVDAIVRQATPMRTEGPGLAMERNAIAGIIGASYDRGDSLPTHHPEGGHER